MFDRKNKRNQNARIEYRTRLLNSSSDFAVSEAYNKMRTNLMYTLADKKCPVIGVTSAFKGGGKSLTMANLAISYSQLGKHVLIIDCDLRSPVQHRIFNLKNVNGVSEILGGFSEGGISVHKIKEYPGVSVLNAGATPPNPSELLAGSRMEKLIALVKEKFDMVIIDLPPINVVTDAGVISSLLDGYVFVVRAGMDDNRSIRSALDTLSQMNANVLGVVLNDVNVNRNKKYGRYTRYGYGKRASEVLPTAVAKGTATGSAISEMTLSEEPAEKDDGEDL